MSIDHELVLLSRDAYGDTPFHTKYSVTSFSNIGTDTQAYLVINHALKYAVLTFRGTQKNGKDILTDIKFAKKKYEGAWIHSGFLDAYLSIKGMLDIATSEIPMGYKFYLTGHSLGGALAALQAIYGVTRADKLVTFGQPRLGQLSTANALSKIHYVRYVNHADCIPRIPRINYYHGGELVYINGDGNKMHNPSSWYMFKDRLWSFINRFTDHKINNYIKRGS